MFDCNICFDEVQEPVISLCGHLYCWPCIFRWIQRVPQPLCPVCKAGIGEDKLIPVYGRGKEPRDPRKNKGQHASSSADATSSTDPASGSRPSAQRPAPDAFNPHYVGPDPNYGIGGGNNYFASFGFGLFPGLFISFGGGRGRGQGGNTNNNGIFGPNPLFRNPATMTEAERRAADISRFMLFLSGIIFLVSLYLA